MGQLRALTIKNWQIYKRNILGSCLQIIIPIGFLLFTILTRHLAQISTYSQGSNLLNSSLVFNFYGDPVSAKINLGVSMPTYLKSCNGKVVALSPANSQIIDRLQTTLTAFGYTVQKYNNDDQIDAVVRDVDYGTILPYFCFGVSLETETTNYRYNLRFNVTKQQLPSPQLKLTLDQKTNLKYFYKPFQSGAMGLNTIINNLILQKQLGSNSTMFINKLGIIYQQKYDYDTIYMYLGNSFQFINLLPLLIIYLRQTSFMLQQKQKKIRESMLITGMKLYMYYLTWFIRYFIIYLVVHSVNSYIITYCFPRTPFYVPFIIYLLFDVVLIVQSFFIQIFVTRAKIGIVLALVFFIIQYAVNYSISSNTNVTEDIYGYMSIVPHVGYVLAFKNIIYGDSMRIPITFTTSLYQYHIITAFYYLLGNIFVWAFLTWYLDQIVPNQWGAKRGICFCLQVNKTSIYEKNQNNQTDLGKADSTTIFPQHQKSISVTSSQNKTNSSIRHNQNYEQVQAKYKQMEQNNKSIIIRNLNKQYDDFHAVRDVTVSIYQDQIFVLLGHNGAGKTSIISMITGMIQPTSGIIQVMGLTDINEIRAKLGVCPQHDTLYDQLTVQQHLKLFATFRGLQSEELQDQVNKLIKDVNLQQKRHEYAKNLSGGQKRRLSVAIAFSGGSKVIILDQPTSGMDTSARRYIWQMLKNYKNGRIIILTTHFMDEADYLGDRIAIMSKGKIMALGSNIFLKNKFGIGYNITFIKSKNSADSTKIYEVIRKQIPQAQIISNVSSQISIQLPLERIKIFSKTFLQIESRKKQLGIQQYGVSITTLQQVFLKVGQQEQQQQQDKKLPITQSIQLNNQSIEQIRLQDSKNIMKSGKHLKNSSVAISKSKQITKQYELSQSQINWKRQDQLCVRFFSHFGATLLKRLRVIKRDIKSFIFQLVLPMVIIIAAIFLMKISFVHDIGKGDLTYDTYLKQQNPVPVPISSKQSDSTTLASIQSKINIIHGTNINVSKFYSNSDVDFDYQYLFPMKLQNYKIRGGIYFSTPYTSNGINILPYTSIMNTRTPTSSISVQSLAAQAYINEVASSQITIIPVNKPFPMTMKQLQINNAVSGFFGALIFSIALAFKFASIVSFIVKEREDNCKHQQIVSGLNIGSYWIGNYAYDLLLYLPVAGFSLGMCWVLQIQSLTSNGAFLATGLLFGLYGYSNIVLTYLVAFLFKDYGNAQGVVYFFNFVVGGISPIIILVLRWIDQNSNLIGRGISWGMRLIPAFSFGQGLINICSMPILITYQNNGVDYKPMDMQIALAPVIYMAGTGTIFIFILFFIQHAKNSESLMRKLQIGNDYDKSSPIQQQDVLYQQRKSINADPSQYEILSKNLRKVYSLDSDKKYKVAVDDLSFGVEKGQVFGLLGVNGAGKSTTFKILSGEIVLTSGQAYLVGLNISENLSEVRKNLGYCPQFDALIQNLTPRQHLELYYDMKCLPRRFKDAAINQMIKQLGLIKHEHKLSGSLSGGNKRKLSVAIAMIGNPSIIFLDEPSTGMDPKARRFMWSVISRMSTQKKHSTVLLTTHSMQQAEALSSRLAIMVNGNFKCIGTPQHIKSKYGKGLQVQIKIRPIRDEQIQNVCKINKIDQNYQVNEQKLSEIFDKLRIQQQIIRQIHENGKGKHIIKQIKQQGTISAAKVIQFIILQQKLAKIQKFLGNLQQIQSYGYYVKYRNRQVLSVGSLFQRLQQIKNDQLITQYAIRQATIEQIFNNFAQSINQQQIDFQ